MLLDIRDVRSNGTRVISCCEMSDMGARNKIQVPSLQEPYELLTTGPALQLWSAFFCGKLSPSSLVHILQQGNEI